MSPALLAGLCAVAVAHGRQAFAAQTEALPGARPPSDTIELAQAAGPAAGAAESAAGAGGASGKPPGSVGADGAAPGGIRWRVAPIRWGGDFGLDWRRASTDGGPGQTQLTEFVNLRAASYIWQPWFVQVTSALSLAAGRTRVAGDTGDSGASGGGMRSVTGAFGVSVFPQSRFPFNANYASTDSRTSEVFTVTDTKSQRLSLRQSYRPVAGSDQYSASFDRSTLSSASYGTDTVDVLNANYSRRGEPHSFDFTGALTRNSRSSDSGGSRSTRVALSHAYRGDEDWQVGTTLSDGSTTLRSESAGQALASRIGFRQLNTFATWTPDTEQPLSATGSFRWAETSSQSQFGDESTSANSRALSATGSALWRPMRQLNLSGSVALSQFAAGDASQTTMSESVSAHYMFDPLKFGNFTYMPSLSGSLGLSSGGVLGTRVQTTAGFNHVLTRTDPIGERTVFTTTLAEGATVRTESVTGASQSLSHNVSVGMRHTTEGGVTGYSAVSLADNRTFGATESSFQMANLQVSGQAQFNRYSTGSANLTIQKTRQDIRLTPDQQALQDEIIRQDPLARPLFENTNNWRTTSSGGATYQNARLFGVPRLRYTANITMFNAQLNNRLAGDLNAPRENVSWTHEQRLDYTIGLLDLRLTFRLAEVDGRKNALLYLRLSRRFGAF